MLRRLLKNENYNIGAGHKVDHYKHVTNADTVNENIKYSIITLGEVVIYVAVYHFAKMIGAPVLADLAFEHTQRALKSKTIDIKPFMDLVR
jgi:hypothetical protein